MTIKKLWLLAGAGIMVTMTTLGGKHLITAQTVMPTAPTEVTVSPVTAYEQVSGGESKFIAYTLENKSQQTLRITLEAESFTADGESGQPQLLGRLDFPAEFRLYEKAATSAAVPSVTILPRSQKQVFVQVAPPLGVPAQEYPVTLFFVFTDLAQDNQSTALQMRLGSNLIISSASSNREQSRLRVQVPSVPTFMDSFFTAPPFGVKVINDGAFGTLIDGGLQLEKASGEMVAAWNFYPDLVLGKNSRLAQGIATDVATGQSTLTNQFAFTPPLFGAYVLTGWVNSGSAGGSVSRSEFVVEFQAYPWILGLALVVIVVLLLMLKMMRRRRQTRSQITAKHARIKKQSRHFVTNK